MRTILLSNHPEAMLLQTQEESGREQQEVEAAELQRYEEEKRQAEAADRETRATYEVELEEFYARIQGMRAERDAARARGRLWKWMRTGIRLAGAKRQGPLIPAGHPEPQPPPPLTPLHTQEEAKLEAGMRGEREVAAFLADSLGDEWTLLRGYRNRRGEIDQLLLGPVGIIAIEVKHWNATVHCKGDEWWFEKYDRYDNRVKEPAPMTDAKGRPPSRELNEPADALKEFLDKRGQPTAIARVVLLTHERGQFGLIEAPTVCAADYTGYLLELIAELEPTLDPARAKKVEELILHDHDFHDRGA